MMNAQKTPLSPPVASRRSVLRRFAAGAGLAAAVSALSACGFKLRGSFTFSFQRLIVTGKSNTPVSRALQNNLTALGVAVGSGAAAVDGAITVVLNVVTDQRERAVVGQTSNGQVRELVLRQLFRYSLSTPAGKRLIPEQDLMLERNISFSEAEALSKAAEEDLLFNDMQLDAVQQVMRRLSAIQAF